MGKVKHKKRWLIGLIAVGCLAIICLSPIYTFIKSVAVMGIYSKVNQKESLLKTEQIDLHIPGGLSTGEADWYPFVMTFSADASYGAYIGEPGARLTILYNFPAFSYTKGCSRLFDENSAFYNAFYGAYIVRDRGNEALASGFLDENRVAEMAKFDFVKLVLGDFGLNSAEEVFQFEIIERQDNVSYVGFDGWTRLRAAFTVNGAAHNRQSNVTSYLQYGPPNFEMVAEEFAPVSMEGLIYGRYFQEADVGVYFYVMSTSKEICDACDIKLLSNSELSFKSQ